MKGIVVIAAGLALVAATHDAHAQTHQATVPPPPGINQPGVDAHAPAAAASTEATPSERLKAMRETLDRDAAAQVEVHRAGDKVIEEYRHNGQLYMVRVMPPNGIPYTYMVDPQGKLRSISGAPPVSPVMYKILDFGKPSTSSEDNGGQGNDNNHGGG